ncbi:ATP-binding cassette domain-containing protein [Alkalibaculum sp. M08DMB]|uniref:ATP-binding cassette domain-containing protein n=1 Tax=Alkalibaculum sporogenes TaxID=2655001 RepID=A0A6A7KCG9_9FIRM|nr:ABC transporter ATP-binding protein [Alkalibaculum sporogenes]MPW27229.1 ATP-binding cassette domain-containing protein [Alkalibaculum sporogenes]
MSNILEVDNLTVTDMRDQDEIVHHISFELKKNSCLGIVGESGSGKSITAKAILGLTNPWLKSEGTVKYFGKNHCTDMLKLDTNSLRVIRGQHICMILQDSMSAFDPLEPIEKQMGETFMENLKVSKIQARNMAVEYLKLMNINDADQVMKKYPHQLSGGMLQRCMIATALAMKPDIIIADEPTTALDSINQREVVGEFQRLRELTGTALIFISHDLGVVQHLSDQLLVMKDGEGVEYGDAKTIFSNPQHEYTRHLIATRLKMSQSFRKAMKSGIGR